MKRVVGFCLIGLGAVTASCLHVSSDPIEVKPIHIVADINLRVDRELDEFFAFQSKYQPPGTMPATLPTTQAVSANPAVSGS
jgi:hypothetical protein